MKNVVLTVVTIGVLLLAATWTTHHVEVATVEINALAVGPAGGAVLPIQVTLFSPGDGRSYVAGVPEAGQGFGPSAQLALYVASRLSGVPYTNYTALLRVISSDTQVGGPSASGYITVAIYALIKGLALRNDTAMTGIILPDGLIGPVGGVSQKVQAAASMGIKTVVVPIGERPNVGGIKVVEVGTVDDAIYYLTGQKLNRTEVTAIDGRTFRQVTKRLLDAVYSYYNQTVGRGYVDISTVEMLKARGMYYAAASIIYRGLVDYYNQAASRNSRMFYNQALQLAKEAESELEAIPLTINNLDLVVAGYTRIYDIYLQANSTSPQAGAMYARAVTLRPWIEEARRSATGPGIEKGGLAEVARMYLDYARSMYAYVETTYRITSSDMAAAMQLSENLYRRGLYLASMATSIDIISRAAAVLMSQASEKYATVARKLALSNMATAARCGYPNTLPLSYLQYGDYFASQNDAGTALTYYIMASIYSTAIGDVVCRPELLTHHNFSPPPPPSTVYIQPPIVEKNDGREMWLVVLLTVLAAVALIYASRR
ncbi:MAG: S16 family serine protease [Pyrobaculum sp.]